MKKYLIKFGLVGTLTFLVFFVYFYKTSGKFRQSIISAFVALTVFFSSQQAAHSAGQADAFTQQSQQHQSHPKNKSIFSRNPNNDGSGPGKPNDDGSDGDNGGIPKYPKIESVEETQSHLSNIDEQIHKLEELTDSECDLIEIESKIKEDSRLVGFAEDAGKDKKIQRDLNGLIEQLGLGNESPGTGTKTLFKGVKEARARSGARVYFRKKNGKIEILAKSNKNPKDQKAVIKILRKKYG